jgi:hypothetical protein
MGIEGAGSDVSYAVCDGVSCMLCGGTDEFLDNGAGSSLVVWWRSRRWVRVVARDPGGSARSAAIRAQRTSRQRQSVQHVCEEVAPSYEQAAPTKGGSHRPVTKDREGARVPTAAKPEDDAHTTLTSR